jgi:chromate reductase
MAKTHSVAVVVGSIRKGSFNRKIANALIALAPSELKMEIAEISQLSFYNQDLDDTPPADWVAFRDRIRKADAVLFVTPEYNRSAPGVLKNAIDVASRPYGQSAWDEKPTAVISCSPGNIGGFGANHHLRQSLVFLNMPCLQQPEVYLAHVDKSLDEAGNVTNEDTKKYLTKFITAFAAWVATHVKAA